MKQEEKKKEENTERESKLVISTNNKAVQLEHPRKTCEKLLRQLQELNF